jgi:hypothetical protein
MSSRFKTIAVTAVATTLFWVAVIAIVVSIGGEKDDRIKTQFITDKGAIGMFDSTNTKKQPVTLLIEEMPTDANATSRIELVRRELAPGQRFRVGYREVMESGQ